MYWNLSLGSSQKCSKTLYYCHFQKWYFFYKRKKSLEYTLCYALTLCVRSHSDL